LTINQGQGTGKE